MSLPSLYLDAFMAVAQSKGFSSAAQLLNVTQSALSQRVKNLEDELGLSLFVRTPTGALLTEQGERLLRYCQTRNSLEEELIEDLNVTQNSTMTGTIRIAGYSSVLRSVLVPSLKPLLEKHPNILCEFTSADMGDLPGLLQRAEVDFIVMDSKLERANIETITLGQETYVMIAGKEHCDRDDIFLDNDANDHATELFFRAQSGHRGKTPKYRRSYFADCYGIIDGVAMGLGRAVMSKHLVTSNKKLKIVSGYQPLKVDVVLHYYQQPFYSKLHQAVVKSLAENAPAYL